MKKTLIVLSLIATMLAMDASADFTSFQWESSGPITDGDGEIITSSGDVTVLTYLSSDANIDFNPLAPLSDIYGDDVFYAAQQGNIAPHFLNYRWSTEGMSDDGSIAGMYAYVVILHMPYNIFTDIAAVGPLASLAGVGTPYCIGAVSGSIVDLQPNSGPVGMPQRFDGGACQMTGSLTDITLVVESAYGSPSPAVGSNVIYSATSCSVNSPVAENTTNFVCTGWIGTGVVPSSGTTTNTGPITINEYSTITWQWTPGEYWLDTQIIGNGSLDVGDGWQPAGTNLPVIATPDSGWLFMGWSGDLSGDYTTTNNNLVVSGPKTITATFSDDADEDGLTNAEEGSLGTDPRDSDSDNDLISDYLEVGNGLNPLISNIDTDSDSDGLYDADEVNSHGTDPLDDDSDDDTLLDGDEIITHGTDPLDDDSDDDLIRDDREIANGLDPLVSNTGMDSDSDNLSDLAEVNTYGTNPLSNDTDGDMLLDFAEIFTYGTDPVLADTDADGLTDHTEIFSTLTSPFNPDTDSDGLSDGDEINVEGTNPKDSDSDDDGLNDGEEINTYYTDPLDDDTDNDGLTDGDEVNTYYTIPTDSDTDNDGASDGDEVLIHGTDPNDNLSDADMDEDGIYDVWEREHFGVIENCDPGDDPDLDLYTNIEEFNNGTDPNALDVYLMHQTALELWYKAASGVVYQVQSTTNLTSGLWDDVSDSVTGDGQTHYMFESTRPAPNKSYRVIILP